MSAKIRLELLIIELCRRAIQHCKVNPAEQIFLLVSVIIQLVQRSAEQVGDYTRIVAVSAAAPCTEDKIPVSKECRRFQHTNNAVIDKLLVFGFAHAFLATGYLRRSAGVY